MVLWKSEIEAFRLDDDFHSVNAVMTTVDNFDTLGTALKGLAGTASTQGGASHVTINQNLAAD